MKIVKLDAIDSTSSHLKGLLRSGPLDDFTVVVAKEQLSGRGQMGAKWYSEPGKNLMFSVLKRIAPLPVIDQFRLTMCTSLAIYDALKKIGVPDLQIKWPNDILSGTSKICGILIENMLSGHQIETTIIGIGLNVNQTNFINLPNASSLKLLLGKSIPLEGLLHSLLCHMKERFLELGTNDDRTLQVAYESVLFAKDKPMVFTAENQNFMGMVKGVSLEGKLLVSLENNETREFDLKEVKMLY